MTTKTAWADFVNGIAYNDTTTAEARRDILNQMINAASALPQTKDEERTYASWIKHYATEALANLNK